MPRRKPPTGRPSKLLIDPTVQDRVCASLLRGSKRSTAANRGGVPLRTLEKWMHLGREKPASCYGEFDRAVRGAEAECQETLSGAVMDGVGKDGRLALDMLSRRWPKLWPREPSRHELSAKVEVGIPVLDRVAQEFARLLTRKADSDTPPEKLLGEGSTE